MTHFMGADRVARVGAVRSAMRASGKRRNAAPILYRAAPRRPTRGAGRFWPPAAPTHCLLYQNNGAARALLAAKIASVKCVIIYDLWYQPHSRKRAAPL